MARQSRRSGQAETPLKRGIMEVDMKTIEKRQEPPTRVDSTTGLDDLDSQPGPTVAETIRQAAKRRRERKALPPGHFWDETKGLMEDVDGTPMSPPPTKEEMAEKTRRRGLSKSKPSHATA